MASFFSLPLDYLCGLGLAACSAAYLLIAVWRVATRPAAAAVPVREGPAVTVLKPLCGAEPALYECLKSFCTQDYRQLQLVFGVADPGDAAIRVVERLIREFPTRDIDLVVDRTRHGTNLKVSNLVNMMRVAKHDVIIVSDSDVLVSPDCIARVVAPLEDARTGAVTCLYRGRPAEGFASALGALFINDWFLPSAAVDAGMREVAYCFGPVTAVRRDALDAIGGFAALAPYLADDFLLGRRLAAAGYRVRLSDHLVDVVVAEDPPSLIQHELRWARTVRTVKPGEHLLSGVMEPLPLLLLLLLPHGGLYGWAAILPPMGLRILLHYLVHDRFAVATPLQPWLVPVRECLCFGIWVASFFGTSVRWRQLDFRIGAGGQLVPRNAAAARAEAVT
jgi:ceramide glucosyltransferase